MAFIGNTNQTQAFTPATDYFSGNGSTTAFTLSRPVASVNQVLAVVNNVDQDPASAYTVSGNTITFTSAPSSGTNNIYVRYTSPITQVNSLTQNPSIVGDATINGVTVGKGGGSISTNTVMGVSALQGNTTGSTNSAFGYQAAYTMTTDTENTAVGYRALYLQNGGGACDAFGSRALYNNTTGSANQAFGQYALYSNNTGSQNVAIGQATLYPNTSGSYNVGVGYNALRNNSTASQNTAVGYQAGYNYNRTADTTGLNTFVGYQAGYNVTTAQTNVCIGSRTGDAGAAAITGNGNTLVGDYAGHILQGAVANNTFIGQNAGNNITTGSKNTILGAYGGNQGGLDIRTSSNYVVLSDGDGNPRITHTGNDAILNSGTLGDVNGNPTANTLSMGGSGWYATMTGANNYWNHSYSGTVYNLRYRGSGVGSIVVNSGSVAFNTTSDYRLKENVQPMTGALAKVAQLKPVTYTWKATGEASEGFIAHELAEVCPLAVTGEKDAVEEDGSIKAQAIDTSFLVATLTAAIQEQQEIINDLKARIETLEAK